MIMSLLLRRRSEPQSRDFDGKHDFVGLGVLLSTGLSVVVAEVVVCILFWFFP